MEIKQMIYFKTIVEEGTISKAAQVLHMAHPPLSMQLKQLEEELGVQLMKRGHRKVELTPAGRLFYKRSLQIIALSEMTVHELKDTQYEMIRIGITSSNSALVQELKDFIVTNAHLSFRIHEGSTYEIIDLLLAHNIDVGIVRTPFDHSQLEVYELRKEPMIAVGTNQYLNQSMTKMNDYKEIPLIIHQRYLPLITDYCLNLQFNPFIKMSSDDCRTSLIWAQLGLGVAIIPKSALPLLNDTDLTVITLEDQELYTHVVFITRKQEKLHSKTQELIQQFFN